VGYNGGALAMKKFFPKLIVLILVLSWLTIGVGSEVVWAGSSAAHNPCDNLPNAAAKAACGACIGNSGNAKGSEVRGFWTALGCLRVEPGEAVNDLFVIAVGVGGIFILIQILMGAFGLITSAGNPAAIDKARNRILDSTIALLFLIFSVTILQVLMMNILKLPGLEIVTST
jgi:hypothetical protein